MTKIKPVIKVWCLPPDQSEEKLRRLKYAIVGMVTRISELGLMDENDLVCLFPIDHVKYALREEIIVEVTRLAIPRSHSWNSGEIQHRLAKSLGEIIQSFYPVSKVECSVDASTTMLFWTSATSVEKPLEKV